MCTPSSAAAELPISQQEGAAQPRVKLVELPTSSKRGDDGWATLGQDLLGMVLSSPVISSEPVGWAGTSWFCLGCRARVALPL